MTTIQLVTADQNLAAVGKVKIASGDINSVQLAVDFDSAWDEFVARTATFHTSKDSTVHEMLLTDDMCIIPHEVLAESCTLFIGVRGAKVDGSAVKTSTLAKYNVVEGAAPGYTTIKPTMDLYQQYLAAMQEGIDPLFSAYKANTDKYFAEKFEGFIDFMSGDVLWENPDPGSVFNAQTIALDLVEYKRFVVVFNNHTSGGLVMEDLCTQKNVEHVFNQSEYAKRKYTITDSGISFKAAENNSYANNAIPYKVIGYKY